MTAGLRNGSEHCTSAAEFEGNWRWNIWLVLSELAGLGGRNKQAFEHTGPFLDFT